MTHEHRYAVEIAWTGNRGEGTRSYDAYGREHVIRIVGKPDLSGSADAAFRGDVGRHNPEELLLAALSACHMLWYLHLAVDAGVVVASYVDQATGSMTVATEGGRFLEATLRPEIALAAGDAATAEALHETAHRACFIANSVNFPVRREPCITHL